MSKIIVQKYGGSSVSDIESIQQVAHRIAQTVRSGWKVVVVVSAMGNTTDALISLAKMISAHPTRRELDLLISVGERISMTLLAMAVSQEGIEARSFTGSQSGIITDEQHVSAKIIEVRPHRIQKALDENCVAIIAGFQGMSRSKEVTTLGRGGSDATAVALTAALGAHMCEICSDVDGVYSADPRVVETAKKWNDMNLYDAWLLAKNGAKVLQAAALEYALEKGIALCANATSQPVGCGTVLHPERGSDSEYKTFGVASQNVYVFPLASGESPDASWVDAIIHSWLEDGQVVCLVDPTNLHQEISDALLMSTVSVVGKIDLFGSPILEEVRYWWLEKGVLKLVVSHFESDRFVRLLHEHLQT